MSTQPENPFRPSGFPFSEEEYQDVLQHRLFQVVTGQMKETYDEWALRGTPLEKLNVTVAVGIFPAPSLCREGFVYESVLLELSADHKPFSEYWKDITTLPYTDRAKAYEEANFGKYVKKGDSMLQELTPHFLEQILPSGAVLFGKVDGATDESAYLITFRYVPPSATYRHIIIQAQKHQQLS